MINIREVAKIAGVSPSTVSRVINGSAKVSPKKTAKVLHPMLPIGFVVAVLGALLLFQTYFIGPITWVIKEIPA